MVADAVAAGAAAGETVDAVVDAALGVDAAGAALEDEVPAAVVAGATAVLGAPEASDLSPAGALLPPRKSVTYQPEPLS